MGLSNYMIKFKYDIYGKIMETNIYNKRKILLASFIIVIISACMVDNCYCFLRTKLNEESRSDSKRPVIEPIANDQKEQEDINKGILMELRKIRAIKEKELEMKELFMADFRAIVFITFFSGIVYIFKNINVIYPYSRHN